MQVQKKKIQHIIYLIIYKYPMNSFLFAGQVGEGKTDTPAAKVDAKGKVVIALDD